VTATSLEAYLIVFLLVEVEVGVVGVVAALAREVAVVVDLVPAHMGGGYHRTGDRAVACNSHNALPGPAVHTARVGHWYGSPTDLLLSIGELTAW
jgi:hypothetical protein